MNSELPLAESLDVHGSAGQFDADRVGSGKLWDDGVEVGQLLARVVEAKGRFRGVRADDPGEYDAYSTGVIFDI